MEYYELYVTRIRELCKERGFTINKLATMSNVKQSTLDNIVRGLTKNPRVKTLHKIEAGTGIKNFTASVSDNFSKRSFNRI